MNSYARTKRYLHVFIFNFFASLILFSSNSVWALTGKEARHLGQRMISHSTNIEGIGKANLDSYRQAKDYDTNSNLGISAMKHSVAIQTMGGVNLGNINLLEAANALLNYSDSVETFNTMKKGAVVVNEIENQLQDKLRRREYYRDDLSVYADQHDEVANQKSSLLDHMANSTKSLIRGSVAGWKTARTTFLDEDKLTGKKVGAVIAVTKAIDNIQTLFSLGSALIAVMSQDNPKDEDVTKALSDIIDLANKTKTSSGLKLISATTSLNKNIARLKSIKKNNHYVQPDVLKYTLRIAEQIVVEDILSNVDDMLEVVAKTAGLGKEMEAFTSIRKLQNKGNLDLVQTRLENNISIAKDGRVPLDDGIRAFQAATNIFESDLGAVIDREPEIKDDVFGVNEGNYANPPVATTPKLTSPTNNKENNTNAKSVSEPDEAQTITKQEADTHLSQNKKRAEVYQALYTQLKNDPNNRNLKARVAEAEKLLLQSTSEYIEARQEVRKTDPNYGQLAYSRDAIRSRIDEKFSAQHAVEQQIDRVSQERSKKKAQLRKEQDTASNLIRDKNRKQSQLDDLLDRQRVASSSLQEWESKINELKFRMDKLKTVSRVKAKFSGKRTNQLPKKYQDALKKVANRLGMNWQKMYLLAERLYDKANQEATDLQIRIVEAKNSGGLSTRETLLATRLKREIKSLENKINIATSNAGQLQRELAGLTNEQQTYNKELTALQKKSTLIQSDDPTPPEDRMIISPVEPDENYDYEYFTQLELEKRKSFREPPNDNKVAPLPSTDPFNGLSEKEVAARDALRRRIAERQEENPSQPEQPTAPPTTPESGTPAGKYRGMYSTVGESRLYWFVEQADNTEFGKDSANQNIALNPEAVEKNFNTGGGDHFGDYQYTALGQWNSDNHVLVEPDDGESHDLEGGYWVIGQDVTDIPTQGSASYSGELYGDYINSSGSVSRGVMGGTIGLNVAFTNKTISGNLFVTKSGDFYSAAEFSNASIGQSFDEAPAGVDLSNAFQADMTITSGVGKGGEIGGFIYGQGATEVGGGWRLEKQNEGGGDSGAGASGVFRAKQSQTTSPNPNPALEWAGWGSVVGSGPDSYQYASTGTNAPHNVLPKGGSSTQINLDGVNQSVTATPNYGDYDYVAWGTWDGGSSTTFERGDGATFNNVQGHWAYGQALGPDDIPKSGSASYAGQVMGGYVHHGNGIVEANSITGDINMAVNFRDGNNSLSGTMNLDRNGSDWATASFNTQNARANPTDPDFKAPLNVVGGGSGQLNGSFFGKDAAEVGGSFYVDKQHGDGGGAAGVYRAKKQ